MMSSNVCQHPEPKGGDCTFLNDHLQIRRKANTTSAVQQDRVYQKICKTSPLLLGLLIGNERKDLAGSLSSSAQKTDAIRFHINNPSAKEHMKQKGAMMSSSCGQTRATAQHPSATHSGCFQPKDIFSRTVKDGLPSYTPMYRTNAEVLKLINEKIAFFRARRRKPDRNKPNSSSVPCHSTTFCSDKEAPMHTVSFSLPGQGSIVAGQNWTFAVDSLKGPHTTSKSTLTSDRNGNISALKHTSGLMASSGEVGSNEINPKSITVCQTAKNNQETTSLDKENVSLNVKHLQCDDVSKTEEPVQQRRNNKEMQVAALFGVTRHKHSEVTTTPSVEVASNKTVGTHVNVGVQFPEQANDGSKSVCSDKGDVQTLSSERVNSKEVMDVTNVNPAAQSLSELRELVATLDDGATDAQMDDVSEVLLQQYWNGDRANIHAFESKEYPQIMLEVAATCTQLECPVTNTMFSPPSLPCSTLPLEHQTSWIDIDKTVTGRAPVCEGSFVTKLPAVEDQGNTSTKPRDVGTVQNRTNWSVAQHPGKQGMNVNKQKSIKGLQSYKTTTQEVTSVTQNPSINTISSVKVPLIDGSQEEQLLPHSSSHGVGETVRNNQGAMNPPNVSQYEDISDPEDPVQQPQEHKESEFEAFFEDISDDEKLPTAKTLVETKTPPSQDSPPKHKSLVQIESTSHGKVIPELPQNCCCPYYIETVSGFEQVLCPKCDGDRLLGMTTSGSQSPSIVLNKNDGSDNEVDDWFVMPLKVDDITVHDQCHPDDREQTGTPHLVTVLGSPLRAVQTTQSGSVVTPHESLLETETDIDLSSRRPSCESDDSCETEDSCDYMPTQGRNYLTVSRQAWNNLPSPSLSEQEDQRTPCPLDNQPKETSQTRSNQPARGSDSEDENDSGSKSIQKRKALISQCSHGVGPTSFLHGGGHSSAKDGDCEAENLRAQQLSRCPKELFLAGDRAEVIPDTKTEDSLDGANCKHGRKSSTLDSGGEDGAEEETELKESVHRLKHNPQSPSQIGHGVSPEPPQNKSTQQGLRLMNAKVPTGPAQLGTNPEISSKGNRATNKSKTNKLKRKARRPGRIYSDTSETEDGEEAYSDVSHDLQVSKRQNIGRPTERKDGTQNLQLKENLLTTPSRKNSDDKLEGHVYRKARLTLSDSEDHFSDTAGSSTLHTRKRFSPKEQPPKPPSQSGIVNRLYVQESPQSSECLKLSKAFPVQTPGADGQPHADAVTTNHFHWNREKEERLSSKSFPSSKAGTSAARQPSSQSRHGPTTSGPPFSKINSTPPSARPSALEKVKGIWKDQFYPVSLHKKSVSVQEDNSKNEENSTRETESGSSNPPRMHRRKHRTKSETPLMKKTKSEAKERTRDIKSSQHRRHSCTVSDHYKWKERREDRERSGSRKRRATCSSSPDLDWD